MTHEEIKIVELFQKCADARLPNDFTERLLSRISERLTTNPPRVSFKRAFARFTLIAASLTLLLGFVPNVFEHSLDTRPAASTAREDVIRAAMPEPPQEGQLSALAILGFCREAIRRRVQFLLSRGRKREEE